MKPLSIFGEIDENDIYHAFRIYPEHMRDWISELCEGQSAFENTEENRIPHQIVDGKIVINQKKNGDKYRRQIWDKVGPCVHTRNDQLASQNTIHPKDDRVFSIRELMKMMTIPIEFQWTDKNFEELNTMSNTEKRVFLKKNEINIRQSLGEAVPTEIFRSIALNIKKALSKRYLKDLEVKTEIVAENLAETESLINYIKSNPRNLGFASLCRITELANSKRNEQEAYFTNKTLITEIIKNIPEIDGNTIKVIEPSVGAGNFIPFVIKLFEHKKQVNLTLVDIDSNALSVLKELLKHTVIPKNVQIEYICNDFLAPFVYGEYDLAIGNPPFSKSIKGKQLELYRSLSVNKQASNTSAFFIEKALSISKYVAMVMPKFLLNTTEFSATRNLLSDMRLDTIIDFGERGFSGVLIETIAMCINPNAKPSYTNIISVTDKENRVSAQNYITDTDFPYWLIYRDKFFDSVCSKMQFGIFDVYRDRQITNSMLNSTEGIRVIKSRNINDDGSEIIDIVGYDSYVLPEVAEKLNVYKYLTDDEVYLTPNMTYKPRVIRKPKGMLVNGSAAILTLKDGQTPLTENEMKFFSTTEYREFYRTARNRQTRSLNVDVNSVFFFGRLNEKENFAV
jgi:DNA (cytosine-5)-methyltransferase 1